MSARRLSGRLWCSRTHRKLENGLVHPAATLGDFGRLKPAFHLIGDVFVTAGVLYLVA